MLQKEKIVFFGDPHGDFRPVSTVLKAGVPAASIFLGDFDLDRPIEVELADLEKDGGAVYFIHGNHDADEEHWYDNVFSGKWADKNLTGKVVKIRELRVAGLGGVFRGRIWNPHDGPGGQKFKTRKEFMKFDPRSKWRGGLGLNHRATIFPEDIGQLANLRADILVTHEAPSCHKHGFSDIDLVAKAMGVKLIVHGHHHVRYADVLPSGIRVVGVELAGTWETTFEDVLNGQL